jgi:hypothetical protein
MSPLRNRPAPADRTSRHGENRPEIDRTLATTLARTTKICKIMNIFNKKAEPGQLRNMKVLHILED